MNYSSRYSLRYLYSALSFQFWNNLLIVWKFSIFFSGDSGIGDVWFILETKDSQKKVIHFNLFINYMSQISPECQKSLHIYAFLAFMWNYEPRGKEKKL